MNKNVCPLAKSTNPKWGQIFILDNAGFFGFSRLCGFSSLFGLSGLSRLSGFSGLFSLAGLSEKHIWRSEDQ